MKEWIKIFLGLFIVGAISLSLQCGGNGDGDGDDDDGPGRQKKDWTIMVYLDGDNNLEGNAIGDFNEMEVVGSGKGFDILVQIDRIPEGDSSNGDWAGTRRYHVKKDSDTSRISSTLVSKLGELNMGDPVTLENFIKWGIKKFPSSRYAVIIWDHGSGWKKKSVKAVKGVAVDDTDGSDYLTNAELESALSNALAATGVASIDLIGFDACLMQMTEVAYYLGDYADVMVGSEETEPVDGWTYDVWLADLALDPLMDGSSLGEKIVQAYHDDSSSNSTLSAVDLSFGNSLATSVDAFAGSLISNYGTYSTEIDNARIKSLSFNDPEYIDLYHFAERILASAVPASLQTAAQGVMDSVDDAVIKNLVQAPDYLNAHGLSIYYPVGGYVSGYDSLAFAQDTQWDDFVCGVGLICGDPYEPNDYFETAYPLPEDTWLSTIAGRGSVLGPKIDRDAFIIDVTPGEERVLVDCTFIHGLGDIDIELYDSDINYLTGSYGVTDGETIDYTVSEPGTYYIVVYNYDSTCNQYDLMWDDIGTVCGDDSCDAGETDITCPEDCGCQAIPGFCDDTAPYGCYCDAACVDFGDCCSDACSHCGYCP